MPSDEPPAKEAYDRLADQYAEEIETNPYNAHLDFPATTALIPDVDGKRVLDAGCGAGLYTEWLLEQGAEVVGVDASEAMLDQARERVGERAEFYKANLAERLGFAADDEFDGIVSALVLGYIEEWGPVFEEFARVLTDGGFLVFSVKHPFDEFFDGEGEDYFAIERVTKDWDVEIPCYRRPLSEMLDPILDAGLRIDRVVEPQPTEGFEEVWPERYARESKHPVFIAMRAVNQA